MNDRTIPRAAQRGTRTVPVERGYAKQLRGNIRLHPDDVAVAVEMARRDRIEESIRDYARSKRDD